MPSPANCTRYQLPVVLVDERASSIEAAQRFAADRAEGRKRRRDAEALDAVAAAVIVERWLAAPDQRCPVEPSRPRPNARMTTNPSRNE